MTFGVCVYSLAGLLTPIGFVYTCQLYRHDDACWGSGNCVCCHLVSAWSGRSV